MKYFNHIWEKIYLKDNEKLIIAICDILFRVMDPKSYRVQAHLDLFIQNIIFSMIYRLYTYRLQIVNIQNFGLYIEDFQND